MVIPPENRAPRRVVFINRYFYPDESATAQLLADLAFGLAAGGFEVHVICSRQLYGAADARLPAEEIVKGVAVHRLWTTRFGRRGLPGRAVDYVSFHASCAAVLMRRLRPGDIVVAKTDPPLLSILAAAVAKRRGAILVNWLQDVFPEVATQLGANPLPALLDRLLRRSRDVSLRAAAVNVVLGSRMREYLRALGVPPERIQVIENWADADSDAPKPAADSRLRLRLEIQRKFVVQYSGNLGRAHDYGTILGAAEGLRHESDIAFLMIGGGVNMDALRREAAVRVLPNLQFLPYQPREILADSLAAADVHLVSLLPALEGLIVPSKFYGILAAGRPVVFIGDTDGELARIIREARCGLVVAAGHPEGLADALRHLRSDGVERDRMGARARRLLSDNYSAQGALGRWAALLAQIR